jgi:hypothetical protein
MFSVVTGRFNNETRDANYAYRKKHNYTCMYCVPYELSPKILYNTPVFVIEMNNYTNKIEGIGLIKNKPATNRYYKVHEDGNTNRFIYIGDYFLEREVIDNCNSKLVYILEEILFKGYTHSKRGTGLTTIPEKVLKFDICEGINIKKEIKDIFVTHFRGDINTKNDEDDVIEKK